MTVTQYRGAAPVQRYSSGGLAEIVEMILDKGLVIDVFIRVQLVGIEILTIDVRICIASVDTYLRFAEATNRVDLYQRQKRGATLPELVEIAERGTRGVVRGKGEERPRRGEGDHRGDPGRPSGAHGGDTACQAAPMGA
jgi:hypothetical protein